MKDTEYKYINIGGKRVGYIDLNGRKEYKVSHEIADWYKGPKSFNLFYLDFSDLFNDKVENVVPENKRLRGNLDNLTSVAWLSDEMESLLNDLIKVVNCSSRPVISKERKNKYILSLQKIAAEVRKYCSSFEDDELIMVPMKGGSYFLRFLYPERSGEKVMAIECKRIPAKDKNSFSFGMRVDPFEDCEMNERIEELIKKKHIGKMRIVELCIVSGMTTIGFLLYLYLNKIKPELIEVNTIAMSQQGYEAVDKFAKEYGFNVKFVTGGIFYRLGNFYSSHRDELLTLDEKLVVGDVKKFLD